MKNNFCTVRSTWLELIDDKHAYTQAVCFSVALTSETIVTMHLPAGAELR